MCSKTFYYTKTMISLFTSALNVTGNLVSPMPNWLHVLKATMCFKSVVRILLDADEEDVFKDETKSGATTPPPSSFGCVVTHTLSFSLAASTQWNPYCACAVFFKSGSQLNAFKLL